ncbi:MAG: tetratricopeptide repeat protein, partial [Deltaproteobacteria bacterium]|nr:tetratricopeptide repeat protein [Deltaproteobacteria bacterium]
MKGKNTHTKTIFNIRLDILVCLFLAIVTLAVYWQVINYAFVFDDDLYVAENFHVRRGLTSETVAWAFTTTSIANWHPLTWLSHMLDIQLYGLNPGSHHLTNVLFHIANTLLLFLILTRMTGALWQSAFVAVLFALHPLHVESVAWISERKDVLSTFFWMLTMWSYIRYVELPGVKRYLLILLFFILGLMVKPMLVTLPFVLLLMDYWPLGRFQFSRSGGAGPDSQPPSFSLFLVWEKIPFIVLAAAVSVVAFLVQRSGGAVGSLEIFPIHYRIMNALVSYVSYIGKMIWPFNLALLYPYPGKLPWWHVSGAFLLLLSISLLSIRNVRRFPWFAVGWLWYLGTLVPVIGLVQIGPQAMADRYTYVPLIGLFIMIAWGIPEIFKKWRYKKEGLVTITVVLLLMLTVISWSQVRYWRNSVTLFKHTLDVTEDNYVIHNNLGFALAEMDRTPEAIWHYSEALRINPRYEKVHNNIGTAFILQGQLERAVEHF